MYRPAAHIQDDELYLPAGQLGMGWWGDAWDEVKSVAKKVQANQQRVFYQTKRPAVPRHANAGTGTGRL